MKKIILYYLYGIILIPIVIRVFWGRLDGLQIHPGLFINGLILSLLLIYFIGKITKKVSNGFFAKMIFGFTTVYFVNFFVVELVQFSNIPVYNSLEYTSKIYLLLLLSFYIFKNAPYFLTKVDKILLINSLVLIINIVGGNYFQIGWLSYYAIENSQKGFTGGNESSIYSFVASGYALYTMVDSKYLWKKYLSLFILIGSMLSLYIIATKGIIVAGIILILFLINKILVRKKFVTKCLSIIVMLIVIVFIYLNPIFKERVFLNYSIQIGQSKVMFNTLNYLPESMNWINIIAPGRIITGITMLVTLFTDNLLNILFGYGIGGIYKAFGRPPMMDSLAIIGYYGVFGFFVFYLPQLILVISIIKKRAFDMINVLFLSVFLYGSLGGFLYGTSGAGTLYAFLFALSYYKSLKRTHYFISQ